MVWQGNDPLIFENIILSPHRLHTFGRVFPSIRDIIDGDTVPYTDPPDTPMNMIGTL